MSKPIDMRPGKVITVHGKPWSFWPTPGFNGSLPELKPYTGKLEPLSVSDFEYFEIKYGIITPNGRIFRGEGLRYIMPIFSPVNALARGHVARRPWDGSPLQGEGNWTADGYPQGKKAITYMAERAPVQSFYKGHGPQFVSRPLVIVEDQLSAIKLAEIGLNAMAILGTPNKGEIGMDKLTELTRIANTETIVALDADATEQAFEFARKWGSAFKKLRVAILSQDIKDTPKGEIFGVLGL